LHHPSCACQLKRIGEDVREKLDYTPGLFTVERRIRRKWACAKCKTLSQAPVPAQTFEKGIATQACWPTKCWWCQRTAVRNRAFLAFERGLNRGG
jgi:transposase